MPRGNFAASPPQIRRKPLDKPRYPWHSKESVMKIKWTHLTSLVLCFGLVSCQLPTEAEKLTAETISPEFSAYVESDANLSTFQKAARQVNVDSWRERVGLPPLPPRQSQVDVRKQMDAAAQPQTNAGQAGPGAPDDKSGAAGKAGPAEPADKWAKLDTDGKWGAPSDRSGGVAMALANWHFHE